METVESLVDRAKHLVLHDAPNPHSYTVDQFHPTVEKYIEQIYKSVHAYAPNTTYFLNEIQHDAAIVSKADALASVDAFHAYMKDANSSAMVPEEALDLSAPLSDYFISSSHNTYLTGNQLYSDAAASAYTSVLLRGCRSVEIDVWDGELDTPSTSDGETSSDSSDPEAEDGQGLRSKLRGKMRSKKDGKEKAAKGPKESVSSKLEAKFDDVLRRKSSKSPQQQSEEVATSHLPVQPEPRVLHGHTLTKGTTFREICYAIRESAFVASDLPLVISLEVHASLEQQQTMVDIMQEAWKGLLVEAPSDDAKLPPLLDLRKKILIKSKCGPLGGQNLEDEPLTPQNTLQTTSSQQQQPPPKPSKILDALANMAVYTRGYTFSHFDQPEAKVPSHIFSLSEKAAREAHINHPDALFEHNRRSLMRIYPYAFRINSSNLDPTFYWRRGAQIVALNWQNLDKGMMLNHGMFVGSHGWRLKPSGYRSSTAPTNVLQRRSMTLSIEVYAAQDLSLPEGDTSEKGFKPYVNCQLHVEEAGNEDIPAPDDASSDDDKSSYRRCTKSSSGRNPDFKGQKLEFPTVTGIIEELSFLRFKIKNDEFGRDPLAAWACIRLDRLREGYRFVHLHDCTGEKTGGLLLVNIKKQLV
ncbi:C2 membrane targeting protein [Penicillium bovifimosum]|uniref:Phosphoinositide phospholipase C n=1 Tax=Penicillium bovifimosum TaxID=126998 RepID=A0A9W9KXJ3_9EURO|nr:C2 membrane targeting protein [Penicillium bovifimosum]KAJ5124421.1 C2 membrane targeting protein [Penicillium bovifimosum]